MPEGAMGINKLIDPSGIQQLIIMLDIYTDQIWEMRLFHHLLQAKT